ncbi:MAG TPA: flagellar basal body rod protein FlgF [Rudaea sp.]|jgi:flagellar basal-body rod protein FlgF|nr:flagellar basal body rod protein FlgF [Rudaea sp.]
MDNGIYTAMTGASATLRAQSVVAENLANSDSTGFKQMLAMTTPYAVSGPGLRTRVDTQLQSPGFDARPGTVNDTNNPLDVALKPDAWIAVQDSTGAEAYTRAGDLRVTENGQLTTSRGNAVLSDGGPITVPPYQSVNIAPDGTVSIVPQGQTPDVQANVGRIRTVQLDGKQLARGEDGLMHRSTTGDPPASLSGNVLTPGALEGSNVNASEALIDMISLSRQFDLQVQVLHNNDDNAKAASSLLKLST